MKISIDVFIALLLLSGGIGYVACALFNAKAIKVGEKLLTLAENDYDAAINHVYSFLRLKR